MAQVVKLKRTAVAGKVPSTSNLELGELAINTYDGKIFFQRDNGTPSIQQVLTTNTSTTGSISVTGDVSASNLQLSGNATINGNLILGGNIKLGDSSTDTVSITADLSSSIIPDLNATFDLGSTTKKWNNLYVVTSSADYFIGDGSHLTNLTVDIAEVASVNQSFSNSSNFSVSHNFNTRNIIVSVYDSNYAQIIPTSVILTDDNNVTITLSSAQSGYVVVAKGGHIVSGSADDSNRLNGQAGSYYLDFTNHTNIPSGLVSGSSQVSFNEIIDKPTLVSGSSQVSYTALSDIPQDIVSGSSQISYPDLSNIPSGIVSGSSQVSFNGIIDKPTLLSGSSQVSYTALSNIPSGIVSQSVQVIDILDSLNSYSSSLKTAVELTGSNVVILGDLSVRGTTTTINSTTVQLDDNIIELNGSDSTNGGLYVKDATAPNNATGSLLWDTTNDYWKAGVKDSESKVLLAGGDSVVSGSSQITISDTIGYTTISSSLDSRIVSLNNYTTSQDSKNFTLETYTSSIDSKFTTLGTYSGSIDTKWSTLENVTSSLINATSSYEVKGSGIISGSSQVVSSLVNQSLNLGTGAITASYFVGDGSGITNVVTEIAEVATVTSSFDNTSSISVTHNFNSKNVIISVYQSNDIQLIPQSVTLSDNNTADITLSGNHSGYVVVAKGGHIVSGSTDWSNLSNKPVGIVSGSTQITDLTTYKESVTGNSTYLITHSLNEEYPIVQAWNTQSKRQEIPQIVESTSINVISISFSSTFSGLIIVKK